MRNRSNSKLNNFLMEMVSDEKRRNRIQFISTFALLGTVALFMTVVNVFTGKTVLMCATLVFAALCAVNAVLCFCGDKALKTASYLFMPEILVLITFFVVSGTPEGFSAIWAALIPMSALLLYQNRKGSVLALIQWALLLFFFWTPLGQSFLLYDYTASFKLRFPFLYLAFYLLALILEIIRAATFNNYNFMCSHDPLTGAMNRRGFSEMVQTRIQTGRSKTVGFVIFDLDHFKLVNDTYGHFTGDFVLQETEKRLSKYTGMEICRWGGEEFALLAADKDITPEWINEVVANFSKDPFTINDVALRVTVSAGAVAIARSPKVTGDYLCKQADICLYEAKETGRNKAVFRMLDEKDLL